MKKVASLVLVLALGLAVVEGENQSPTHTRPGGRVNPTPVVRSSPNLQIANGLKSLITIISEYKRQIHTKVRLPELQEAIETIDKSMLGYQGMASMHLDGLRTQFSTARLSYEQCVDPIFEWCISIKPTINSFLAFANDTSIKASDRNLFWNILASGLQNGLITAYDSLSRLSLFESQANDVARTLNLMNRDLKYDFNQKKMQLSSEVSSIKNAPVNWNMVVERIYKIIVEFMNQPSGNIFSELFTTNHWSCIKREKIASKQTEMEIIIKFFDIMMDKLSNAGRIAHEVKVGLDAEQPKLAAVIPPQMDIVVAFGNEEVRQNLDPIIIDLNNVCTEYTTLRLSATQGHRSRGLGIDYPPLYPIQQHPKEPSPGGGTQEPSGYNGADRGQGYVQQTPHNTNVPSTPAPGSRRGSYRQAGHQGGVQGNQGLEGQGYNVRMEVQPIFKGQEENQENDNLKNENKELKAEVEALKEQVRLATRTNHNQDTRSTQHSTQSGNTSPTGYSYNK